MALVEKDSNLKPTYRSMPPNIFLSISYSLLNLFDGAILLQDERLLVNQLEQLIQQFSRLAGLAKTKSAKLMLTEQGIFSAKQSANIQQITPLLITISSRPRVEMYKCHNVNRRVEQNLTETADRYHYRFGVKIKCSKWVEPLSCNTLLNLSGHRDGE